GTHSNIWARRGLRARRDMYEPDMRLSTWRRGPNDWLHDNSVDLTPDGNLLLSSRHRDWLIKIDYRNGEGSGKVIWRLGKDGDFRFDSSLMNSRKLAQEPPRSQDGRRRSLGRGRARELVLPGILDHAA